MAPTPTEPPQIVSFPGPALHALEGQELECKASGNPPPEVSWALTTKPDELLAVSKEQQWNTKVLILTRSSITSKPVT